MTSRAIFRRPTPEEAELQLRHAEVIELRAQLATQETALAQLRSQLHHFEARYIRQVGVLYIQLDDWNDRIAELNNPNPTKDTGAPGLASETWAATNESSSPSTYNLKALFREVAKRIHPDFALDADDERRRTHLMAQANDALLRSDSELLRRMVHTHDLPHDTATTAAKLDRTRTLIHELRSDLAKLNTELDALTQSEMADLRRRTLAAAETGQDLLAELAAQVKGRIGLAMRRYELDLARIRRNQPAFNPDALLSAETSDTR